MPDDTSPLVREVSIPIEYEEFGGQTFDPKKRGSGTLVIRGTAAAATFTFIGPETSQTLLQPRQEFAFRSDQIWNVIARGSKVAFVGTRGTRPKGGARYAFFCSSPEAAIGTVQLLPTARDAEFAAAHTFIAKLSRLPRPARPWMTVTATLIFVNVLMFLAVIAYGADPWFGARTMEHLQAYIRLGADNPIATTHGDWWRVVTSMFLHFGVFHLAVNMWALLKLGRMLERLLGPALFALAFFASGIVGSFASLGWNRADAWCASASGGVFGLYGVLLGYMLREKRTLPPSLVRRQFTHVLGLVGYSIVYGLYTNLVDNGAHVGGFVGGIGFGWLLAVPIDLELRRDLIPQRLRAGVAVLALVIVGGVLTTRRS